MRWDRFDVQLVIAKIIFSISENLTSCLNLAESRVHVTGDDWSVVDQVQQPAGMLRQDDLLLSTLNRGRKVVVVGLLKLLTSLTRSATCFDEGARSHIRCCSAEPPRLGSGPQLGLAPVQAARS